MANDLVTLREYKTYKDISTDDKNAQLRDIITHVSNLVKDYCGVSFNDYISSDKVEYFDGKNNNRVFLSEIPLNSVTHVKTSSDGGVSSTVLTVNEDYFIDYDLGSILTGTDLAFVPDAYIEFKSLEVSYKAGYTAVPEAIKLVTMDIVEYYKTESFHPRKSMSGSTIESVSFSKLGDSSFPPHIRRVLDLYRVVHV